MNDRVDPLDQALADGLGALAPRGAELDAAHALGALRPALRRARTRYRVAVSTSVLGALAVFSGGAAALQHATSSHVVVSGRPRPAVTTLPHSPRSTTTAPAPPTTASRPGRHEPTTTAPGVAPAPGGTTPGSGTSGPSGPGGPGEPSTTVPAASTTTYRSIGGTATIRFAGGRVTLVSHTASPGYATEVHTNTPTEIELRFDNGSRESRIRVRVQDGRVQPEISES